MDGLASVVVELQLLVVEQWHRLKEMIQQQLLWLVKQMVVAGTTGVEKVVWQLLRRTGGGGLRAAWLTEQLLSIVEEHFGWLVRQHQLVAALAFTLLRLVEDHSPLQQAVSWGRSDGRQRRENLIEREARMAARLIREQSTSVQVIGRELVRALQHVARWKSVLGSMLVILILIPGCLSLMNCGKSFCCGQTTSSPPSSPLPHRGTSSTCEFLQRWRESCSSSPSRCSLASRTNMRLGFNDTTWQLLKVRV